MAVLLAVLSLAGCSRSLADLFGLSEEPPPVETGGTFTVTYKAGNGDGDTVTQSVSKGDIPLPESDGFTALDSNMVFAGWHDGKFTYEANDPYTVTRDVILEARWGFTSATGVAEYFVPANKDKYTVGNNILLVVCNTDTVPLEKTILQAMISEITAGKTVELDLSASTFGVTGKVLDLSSFSGVSVNKLILPRAATSTAENKLYNGTALHEVSGLNVASIGSYAFYEYADLKTADFPVATTIGEDAFYNCTALTTADFPKAEIIGANAFNGCTELATADFPEADTIESLAFNGCTKLATANFPEAETIGTSAFKGCLKLATANFPKAETIGAQAFNGCTELEKTVDFSAAKTINANAFEGCIALEKANFPKAETIGNYAVSGCKSLTAITIGVDVSNAQSTSIGKNAFYNCTALAKITIGKDYNITSDTSEDNISKGFRTAYTGTTQAAGTYTLADSTWTKTAD
jgi:uncharacterized protein YjbI with pentapeptide repeats